MAIIAIDFDGTIAEAEYPALGKIKPYAKDVIRRLHTKGHKIIIWTCRSGNDQEKVKQYLEKHGILFHHINANDPELMTLYGNDSRKIGADLYIDDKQLGGLPEHWLMIEQLINKHLNRLLVYEN